MYRAAEFGFRLADHVLAGGPWRDVGEQQLPYSRCGRDPPGLGARQVQVGWTLGRVCPGRFTEEGVGAAGQLDDRVAVPSVTAVYKRRARGMGDAQAERLGRMTPQPRQDCQRADVDGLTVDPMPDIENVGEI